jgi:hypothetical protein
MMSDGAQADHQPLANLFVGQSLSHQDEHFGLGHRFGQWACILLSMSTIRRSERAILVPISLWYGAVGRNDGRAFVRESFNCGRYDDPGRHTPPVEFMKYAFSGDMHTP